MFLLIKDGLVKLSLDPEDNLYVPIESPAYTENNNWIPEKYRVSSFGQFKILDAHNKNESTKVLDGVGRRISIGFEDQDGYILEG